MKIRTLLFGAATVGVLLAPAAHAMTAQEMTDDVAVLVVYEETCGPLPAELTKAGVAIGASIPRQELTLATINMTQLLEETGKGTWCATIGSSFIQATASFWAEPALAHLHVPSVRASGS